MSPLVVSVPEAANALGVSDDTITRWLDTGILPEVTRHTRRRLIPRRAIEQLVEQALDGWDPAEAARHLKAAS